MHDKDKLLTRPQLAHQEPFTLTFFWPQRLIACSAEPVPLLLLTPCAEPSYPLHLTKSETPTQPLSTGSHSLQLNFGELEGDNFWFRKQDTDNSSF